MSEVINHFKSLMLDFLRLLDIDVFIFHIIGMLFHLPKLKNYYKITKGKQKVSLGKNMCIINVEIHSLNGSDIKNIILHWD